MNRIDRAFQKGHVKIRLIVGGDPSLEESRLRILRALKQDAGMAALVVPFSDPAGESLESLQAHQRALASGACLNLLIRMAGRLRQESDKPLLLVSYLNPLFQYGYENFFEDGRQAGIDSLLIRDLPMEEESQIRRMAEKSGIHLIRTVAPASGSRIPALLADARGFIHLQLPPLAEKAEALLDRVRSLTPLPLALDPAASAPLPHPLMEKADGLFVTDFSG